MDPTAGSSSISNNEKMAPTSLYLETSMNPPDTDSTISDVDLKDVACVVFNPANQPWNESVYLVDLEGKRLRGFAHLDSIPDLPKGMKYVVYKSKLYMFGGLSGKKGKYKTIGPRGAYVLDLAQLARADIHNNAVEVKRIPDMRAGKALVKAVLLGDKICVFDHILGHNPPGHNFEIFDTQHDTWYPVPDPFVCEEGDFVDGVVVIDNTLFISIGKNTGVYELDLGANASPTPTWIHRTELLGANFIPFGALHTRFRSLLFTGSYMAYDISDDRGLASEGELTVTVSNEGWNGIGGTLFDDGRGKVRSIRPAYLCGTEYKFVVSKCSMDRFRIGNNVNLEVVESFTVPMGYLDEDAPDLKGCIRPVALCNH